MELRSTREMRRNERLDKVMAKKAENSAAPAKPQAQPAQKQAPADQVSLSRQALDWLEEQSRRMWEQNQGREQQSGAYGALGALDSSSSELDLLSKAADVQDKCLKIAASIMKGDRVPPEDLDLAIVPCCTGNARGQRLGYGGGYYDRYLPGTRCPTMLLCRHQLEREDIPLEPHDVRMDYFVTERGLTDCKGGAK